jgi:hypothetical protein
MTIDLNKLKVGFSSLSKSIYLYRMGKDPIVSLDKRKATPEVIAAVIEYMMDEAPKGATQSFSFGDDWYTISVKPGREINDHP